MRATRRSDERRFRPADNWLEQFEPWIKGAGCSSGPESLKLCSDVASTVYHSKYLYATLARTVKNYIVTH